MPFNNTVTVTINDVEVKNIAQGMPIVDCMDETLDSSTLIINPSKQKDRFPIFSEVVTTINGFVKYYYLIEDSVDVVCKDPVLYSHTIQLIEPTKLLERIPCDNLTFTQPAAQATYPTSLQNGEASIYDVIMRIRSCCQLRREGSARPYPFEITNQQFIAYLKGIKAPQFFLNVGNVKDALNQVFKYLNAISRLSNFTELTADFFNKYNELIGTSDLIDYGETQGIENYATSLLSNISNALADYDDTASTIVYPSASNWASVRCQDGILTTDNMEFVLESPIYKIKKLWVLAPTTQGDVEGDISRFVVNKEVYETLPINSEWKYTILWHNTNPGGNSKDTWGAKVELISLGKDSALVYEYLGNSIGGLGVGWKKYPYKTTYVIDSALGFIVSQNFEIDGIGALPTSEKSPGEYIQLQNTQFQNLMYRCEYISTTDTRIEVQRIDLTDFKTASVQQINQATNLVNINAYGDNMYGLLQRLGNSEKIMTKIFKRYEDCPNVGDYTIDGYVVTTTMKNVYNDFVSCVISLTRNFNRRSQFVDIAAETRQFVIPAAGETLLRHCNYGEYIYIHPHSIANFDGESDENALLDSLGLEYFCKGIVSDTPLQVSPKLAFLKTLSYNHTLASAVKQVDTKGVANTLAFTFGFNDNRSVGSSTAEMYQDGDKVVQQPIQYTDENGAIFKMHIDLANSFESNPKDTSFEKNAEMARRLPQYDLSNKLNDITLSTNLGYRFLLYKDPAEVPKFTIQQHILPSPSFSSRLIIGNGLAQECPLICDYAEGKEIWVYVIDDQFQLYENKLVRGTKLAKIEASAFSNTNGKYRITLPDIPKRKSWCIGNDKTKLMYLAYNPSPLELLTSIKYLYFSRRIDRI